MKKLSLISRLFLSLPIGLVSSLPANHALGHSYGEWRDAAHIYASTCKYCHDVGVGPVLMGRQLPASYIELRVRSGFNAMPSFKPSEIGVADLKGLADWIAQSPGPEERTKR